MINRKNILSLPNDWSNILKENFEKQGFDVFKKKILLEYKLKIIRPDINNIFRSLQICSFKEVKVVILGQDPYHNIDQAHGLSFSVPVKTSIPLSLKNIFKELESDILFSIPTYGCLEKWACQGVLLLNSFLTVELHKPLSHSKIGWEIFTDTIIKTISDSKKDVVFLLWGNFAKNKNKFIDGKKHKVLMSAHPSPLSSYKFFGCKHFSKTNDFLKSKKILPVNWSLS